MVQYLISLINRDERGQGLAEYALILALIAVLAIAAVTFLGGQINTILSDVGNKHLARHSDSSKGRRPRGRRPFACPPCLRPGRRVFGRYDRAAQVRSWEGVD